MVTKLKPEKLALVPPETQYISKKFLLKVPITDEHFHNPWHLRLYALQILESQIGDKVQLTSMKVKKPVLSDRAAAKLFRRTPCARLYVTIKF